MSIRSRLKKKIHKILGIHPQSQAAPEPSSIKKDPTPQSKSVSPAEKSSSPQPIKAATPPTIATAPTTPKKKIDEDKIQRHLLRTKKGLLKFLQKEGGSADLAALHTHSETRFLIGHQKFSELMESMVDTKLIQYNWDIQEATITQKGILFISPE